MKYFNLLWNFFKLRQNSRKSVQEIKMLQERKLRYLLNHAYENSTYYHKEFEKAGITKENIFDIPLMSFPTIDKATFMENFDKLVTVNDLSQEELRKFDKEEKEHRKKFKGKYHIVHSSGSTGKPGYFVYDEEAWNIMLTSIIRAALWDMNMWHLLKLLSSGARVIYIAATDGRYGGAMAVGGGIEGLGMKQLSLDINMPLSEWIEKINKFSPNVIIAYPSALKILAELIETGDVKLDATRIISCGEPLGSNIRHYLEQIFNVEIINIYGASESLALGVESNRFSGMYLFDDMNYIEVEDGQMYLTSLYNKVQPLIRYKISDKLTIREADSFYPFTKINTIVGRDEDLLWFEDNNGVRDFLHPLAIEGFCIEGLIDYQFCQLSQKHFEMIAQCSNKKYHSRIEIEMKHNMKIILEEKNLEYVRFDIRFVDSILPEYKTGKKKLLLPIKKY